MTSIDRCTDVYARLLQTYGPQGWWPGERGFEMVTGAILTQRAAWRNAERALANLRAAAALTPSRILALHAEELAQLIRPAGCFRAKARCLRAFAETLERHFDGSLEKLLSLPAPELRERLLAIAGIGPETADAIVLYGAGQPTFVVDAYAKRLFARLGIRPLAGGYEDWRKFFMSSLAPDAALFSEYHALIVRHGKDVCRSRPRCEACCLRGDCPSAAGDQSGPALPLQAVPFQRAR